MALFSRVTVWVSNQVLTAAALNGEFNNILNNAQISSWVGYSATVTQMQTLWNPGGIGTENQPVSGADEVASLRYMIKFLSGGTQWYDQTGRTLAAGGLNITTADIANGAVTDIKRAALNYAYSGTSGAFSLTSGSGTYHTVTPPPETVTITIASPGVITVASTHTVTVNDPVVFTNSGGALPTGITAGTTYYVQQVNSSTQFQIALTVGGAAINTSGSQSGTQTITYQGLTTETLTLASARPVMILLQDDGSGASAALGSFNFALSSGLYAGISQSGAALGEPNTFAYQILRDGTAIATPELVAYYGPANASYPNSGVSASTSYYTALTSGGSPTHAITWPSVSINPYIGWPASAVSFIDMGATAGTHTYSLKVQDQSTLGNVSCYFTRLLAIGL